MENKIGKGDIVVVIILLVVIICGISLSYANRVEKGILEITTENYEKYLSISCGNLMMSNYDATVVVNFKPLSSLYKYQNINVTFSVEVNGVKRENITASFSLNDVKSYQYKVNLRGNFNFTSDEFLHGNKHTAKLTVVSLTGQCKYVRK